MRRGRVRKQSTNTKAARHLRNTKKIFALLSRVKAWSGAIPCQEWFRHWRGPLRAPLLFLPELESLQPLCRQRANAADCIVATRQEPYRHLPYFLKPCQWVTG